MNTNVLQPEKLTVIKGIGEVRAQWLVEIGVEEVQDLLSTPAEEIETRLQAIGHNISLLEIKDWQVQAREVLAVPGTIQRPPMPETAAKPEKAKTFATFVVEFQNMLSDEGKQIFTRVHHMEGGESGEGKSHPPWPGFPGSALYAWMMEEISEKYPELVIDELVPESESERIAAEEEPAQTPPAVADKQPVSQPTAVTITQIRAYQPPDNSRPAGKGLPGQMFQGFLKGNQPFALGIDLALTPASPETAASQLYSYQIQAYATNRQTGGVTQLQPAVGKLYGKGEIKKATKLAEVSLPPGFYRLQIMATMEAEPASLGFLEIPLLQVV